MSETVSSTIKIPVFDGEAKNFQNWCIRFQAYTQVKQFSTALKTSLDLPSSEEEMETLDVLETRKITTGKRNAVAMAHITMALGMESLLNKVQYHPRGRMAAVDMKHIM
eukprot:15349834-Ditylum_brightwellii.AAC.1